MKERRTYAPEYKARVVLELISGKKGLIEAGREYQIIASVLSRLKQEFLERASQVFENPQHANGQEERIAELERLVGQLTLQLDIVKKVLGYSGFPPRENE
jgi:transposase-like protein